MKVWTGPIWKIYFSVYVLFFALIVFFESLKATLISCLLLASYELPGNFLFFKTRFYESFSMMSNKFCIGLIDEEAGSIVLILCFWNLIFVLARWPIALQNINKHCFAWIYFSASSPLSCTIQKITRILYIYLPIIINFEWTYNFIACTIPKHYSISQLFSSKLCELIISMEGSTSSLAIRPIQYGSTLSLKHI